MEPQATVIIDRLVEIETEHRQMAIYDREIGIRRIFEDPKAGVEHYVIRYPAGLKAKRHRHTGAQTILVLEGRLAVDNQVIGPGGYCHFASGQPMYHAPADDEPCVFVTIFQGPSDVEPLD